MEENLWPQLFYHARLCGAGSMYGVISFGILTSHREQGVTGKIVVYGYDNDRRPSIYLLPSRQNTDGPERQLQYTVWNIERAIDLMDQGTEKCVLGPFVAL